MEPYTIGIDIGTGSTKAVALTATGAILATAQCHYPTAAPQPGYAEQDPDGIWQAFATGIRQVTTRLGRPPDLVSFSSCMHSLLATDRQAQPLTPLITWADSRSEAIAAELRTSGRAAALYTDTGTPVHSMSPLCKIIWFRRHRPELFPAIHKFISIKEYIWYRLFGAFAVDHSIASATGLFHITQKSWHAAALELCGITPEALSDPVPTTHVRTGLLPAPAAALGLPVGTPFCIGASDGCLANIGSAATGPGIAALTIGTSGAVRVASAAPVVRYPAMTFNYVLDEQTYICGGPVNNGGNLLQWLVHNLLPPSPGDAQGYAAYFASIAAVPAGSEGLLCLPYLYGERAPVWDEKAAGAFVGVRSHHTRAHFLRAGLEGVCHALKMVLRILEEATGPIRQLHVSGGFVQAPGWLQLLADVTGKRLVLLQTEDASAAGAAALGMKAQGWIPDYAAVITGGRQWVEPDAGRHAVYEKQHAVFVELYGALKDTFHRLYTLNQ